MNASSTPAPKRTFRRTAVGALVLVLVLLAVQQAWVRLVQPSDPLADLQIAQIERGTLEDVVTATGTLQPRDYVDVGAQVSGLLNHIHVEIGDEVEAGELLAEIDPRVLQSRVDAMRAQLRNQHAQLKEREANLILARSQYRREQNLHAEDATTEEAVENARAALHSAEAQIEALRAQIEQSESNLEAEETNLEYTRIYAPMTGTVVTIEARQGQTLNANQQAPTILRIADLSTMTVQTQVSEADIGRLAPATPAYFTTLGGASQRWHGELERIEPTPEVTNNVVLYNALFDVPNPDGRLMTQMTAQVFFVTARAEDALIVPMAALTNLRPVASGPNGAGPERMATVHLVARDGSLEERDIRIGVTSRIAAQVREGLDEGDRVVLGVRPSSDGASGRGSGMFR